ncbi:MAG: condensation domain-containing protein, partial [Bacteroidota bacterium]
MERIVDIFSELRENHIKLVLNEGKLDVISYGEKIGPDILQKIKSHKKELKIYLETLEQSGQHLGDIPLADVSVSYPLSDAQRRLWILSQFTGGSIAYNMPSCVDLYGEYRLDLLRDAITSTLERHEILRTVFKEDESGEVRQWVLSVADLGFVLDYQDFRSSSDPQ